MKEKILLINPSYSSKDIVYFPLGLGYIAGACDREGIEVECIDTNLATSDNKHVIDAIQRKGFNIVGIGGFVTQLKSTIELTNLIKAENKDVAIIIGGAQVFGCEQFIMGNSKADIICMGESESLLPKIVHSLYSDRGLDNLPSIIYRRNGKVIIQEGSSIVNNLDEIGFPKYDTFNMEKYIKDNYHSASNKRTIDFICSRGCPYKCNYCVNSKKTIAVRYRSPENVINEIKFLKNKYKVNDFSFCDEIFTVNKNKALEICESLESENITWITSCRADGIDDELLSAMKRSGCRMLLIGFESTSEKILKQMNKKASAEIYSKAIKLLQKYEIRFYANFMIGMPDEDRTSVKDTERFCINNRLIFTPTYVTPFPGTKLFDAVRHRITDEKKYLYSLADMNFAKEPLINLTSMSMKELIYLRNNTVISTISHLILQKYKYMPLFLIKIACSFYLLLFNIKNPKISRVTRPITKAIHSLFSI